MSRFDNDPDESVHRRFLDEALQAQCIIRLVRHKGDVTAQFCLCDDKGKETESVATASAETVDEALDLLEVELRAIASTFPPSRSFVLKDYR